MSYEERRETITAENLADQWRAIDSIPGWFSREAHVIWHCLLAFQAESNIRGPLMEIGVFKGRSAAVLAGHRNVPEDHLVLVDNSTTFDKDAVLAHVRKLSPDLATDQITLLAMPSARLMEQPNVAERRGRFRFIHIDGEHTGTAVYGDLESADMLLSEDGLVSVDDFFHPAFAQITEAVYRYLLGHHYSFVLLLAGFNKAYLARPKFAHRYLSYIRNRFVEDLEVFGFSMTIFKRSSPADSATYGIGRRAAGESGYHGPDYDVAERYF